MKTWLSIVAFLGFSGVALGAFGAHGIKPQISSDSYANYQTGVLYHFIHTLAILGLLACKNLNVRLRNIACIAFLLGIVLFSGSLYLLATADLTGISSSILGPVTPIGGVGFLIGWLTLFIYSFQKN